MADSPHGEGRTPSTKAQPPSEPTSKRQSDLGRIIIDAHRMSPVWGAALRWPQSGSVEVVSPYPRD
eukprot:13866685-Alexandrium_andersonii.AAC.1